MSQKEKIKVFLRVRSLNNREIQESAEDITELSENQQNIIIINKENQYEYDKIADPQTTQQQFFENTMGQELIENIFQQQINTTIFAYGQTGSGKTYTMVGKKDQKNKGIIYRAFDQLFKEDTKKYNITLSYYEIYNEQIYDLLSENNDKTRKKLQIKQDQYKNTYIQSLTECSVTNQKDVTKFLNIGTKNKSIASTQMNLESSRSHSILQIQVATIPQQKSNINEKIHKTKLNFIDLAGSERQKSTQCTGDRLKEGQNINKSLTVLGKVISALSEQKKSQFISYRESKLTHVLKDSLSGNSRTYMIATISPANINLQETIQTLQFANRVKNIMTTAVTQKTDDNQNNNNIKVIQDLQQQIEQLKGQLLAKNKCESNDYKTQLKIQENIIIGLQKEIENRVSNQATVDIQNDNNIKKLEKKNKRNTKKEYQQLPDNGVQLNENDDEDEESHMSTYSISSTKNNNQEQNNQSLTKKEYKQSQKNILNINNLQDEEEEPYSIEIYNDNNVIIDNTNFDYNDNQILSQAQSEIEVQENIEYDMEFSQESEELDSNFSFSNKQVKIKPNKISNKSKKICSIKDIKQKQDKILQKNQKLLQEFENSFTENMELMEKIQEQFTKKGKNKIDLKKQWFQEKSQLLKKAFIQQEKYIIIHQSQSRKETAQKLQELTKQNDYLKQIANEQTFQYKEELLIQSNTYKQQILEKEDKIAQKDKEIKQQQYLNQQQKIQMDKKQVIVDYLQTKSKELDRIKNIELQKLKEDVQDKEEKIKNIEKNYNQQILQQTQKINELQSQNKQQESILIYLQQQKQENKQISTNQTTQNKQTNNNNITSTQNIKSQSSKFPNNITIVNSNVNSASSQINNQNNTNTSYTTNTNNSSKNQKSQIKYKQKQPINLQQQQQQQITQQQKKSQQQQIKQQDIYNNPFELLKKRRRELENAVQQKQIYQNKLQHNKFQDENSNQGGSTLKKVAQQSFLNLLGGIQQKKKIGQKVLPLQKSVIVNSQQNSVQKDSNLQSNNQSQEDEIPIRKQLRI